MCGRKIAKDQEFIVMNYKPSNISKQVDTRKTLLSNRKNLPL